MTLREEHGFANSGEQMVSVREETNADLPHDGNDRAKPTSKAAPPLSHQHQEEEVRREKGASEAGASLGSPTDSRVKCIGTQ